MKTALPILKLASTIILLRLGTRRKDPSPKVNVPPPALIGDDVFV